MSTKTSRTELDRRDDVAVKIAIIEANLKYLEFQSHHGGHDDILGQGDIARAIKKDQTNLEELKKSNPEYFI